jgi:FtsP/CotA-like multicopper oxidase with cupredoxin domain
MSWSPIALIALMAARPPAAFSGSPAGGGGAATGPGPETIAANDNRHPAGRLEHGVLTLALEVRIGALRPEEDGGPGLPALAFAEVGQPLQVPGPLIRVPQGTEVRVSIRNPLDSTLAVYGFGARPLPNDSGIVLRPGQTRELRFRATTPGTYFYWAALNQGHLLDRLWFDSQLTGAFVVDRPGIPSEDRIFVIGLWSHPFEDSLGVPRETEEHMVINGKSWPHTERLTYPRGSTVRWRVINPTIASHPMHLHGFFFHVESLGDWRSGRTIRGDARPFEVTQLLNPGETFALSWVPEREGNWVFHCHFPFHVSYHQTLAEDANPVIAPRLAAISTGIAPETHASHASDAGVAPMHHSMGGLVLGIHVVPGTTPAPRRATDRPPREIRLLAQSAPRRYGTLAGMGYVVQDGSAEPARDSIDVPGPTLVLRRGEPVRITVVNHLAEPTAVHWHGIELESFPDGVPGWSGTPARLMPAIQPGDSFVAEFVPPRAGTYIYHTHANEQLQMGSGLYGPLLVVDSARPYNSEIDKVIVVGGAGPADSLPQYGFESPGLVNGSDAPPPIELKLGRTYRFRLININPDWRVIFSLTSQSALARWRPVAKDGADLPPSQRGARPAWLLTGPGETADFEFTPRTREDLRLEVKTLLPGWIVPVAVHVR